MKQTILALVFSAFNVAASAQDELPSSPALERAIVVEEIEHDLRQAVDLYSELADDEALPETLRRHAALRLGRAHAALGYLDAARAALERAAAGDDALAALARAELADPGAGEERARVLRAEARRWIEEIEPKDRLDYFDGRSATQNLLWIGRAAVPELVRALESQRTEDNPQNWLASNYAALLWRIGGPEAAAWLDAARAEENVGFRRAVARGLEGGNAREDEMLAVAQRYLADPDPRGDVVVAALGDPGGEIHSNWKRYDVDAILALVDSPVSWVRRQALELLRDGFDAMRHEGGQAATMDRLSPRLARALDDVDPRVGRAASAVLGNLGLTSPASRALVVERLADFGPDFRLRAREALVLSAEEPAIAGLPEMFRQLGPASTTAATLRDQAAATLFGIARSVLDREDLELVLEAQRLGYGQGDNSAVWIAQHCGEEEAERICAAMVDPLGLEALLPRLAYVRVTPACYPYLAEVERILDERDPAAAGREPEGNRAMLLTAFGRTATPEAVERLVAGLRTHPGPRRYSVVADALLRAAARRPEPDVLAALREVLTTEIGGELNSDVTSARQLVFAALVHHGDPQAFALLPSAFALGLRTASPSSSQLPDAQPFWGWTASGVGWLQSSSGENGAPVYFHGYEEDELASIWDALLAAPRGEDWNEGWRLLGRSLGADWTSTMSWWGRAVPREVAPPARVVEVAARRWAERVAEEQGGPPGEEEVGLILLLDIRRRRTTGDAAALEAVADLYTACLESPSADVRALALDMLPAEPDEAGRAAIRNALSDPWSRVSQRAFERTFDARQPVALELFERVLANPSGELRTRAIASLAPLVGDGAAELVKGALADPSADVRVAACRFLGTQVAADSVPELLAALTDIDEDVRGAAAEALRSIRFYHDERAHWDRVFAGTELSANGAAEALLKQAGPASAREVRLLALRSLGTLGVAETLPFLIEWTADPDPELATAARAAITRIHAAGG